MYDFFLDPQMAKLSEIIPYAILIVHGKMINEFQYWDTLGSSLYSSLNNLAIPRVISDLNP